MAEGKFSATDLATEIKDPLLSDNYTFIISNLPNNLSVADPSRVLSLYCQQVQKPGETIEPVPVPLHGHEFQFAGRNTITHDLPITYVENYKMEITTILEEWVKSVRGFISQTGELKAEYAKASGLLRVLDPSGQKVKSYTIYGLWPTQVPEIQFQGDSATLITLQTTFKYDYYEPGEGNTVAA